MFDQYHRLMPFIKVYDKKEQLTIVSQRLGISTHHFSHVDLDLFSNDYIVAHRNTYQKLHNEDGPALVWENEVKRVCGQEYWYNGNLHREDGPAVERTDFVAWALCGRLFLFEQWVELLRIDDRKAAILLLKYM